jgi:hypothetical protein
VGGRITFLNGIAEASPIAIGAGKLNGTHARIRRIGCPAGKRAMADQFPKGPKGFCPFRRVDLTDEDCSCEQRGSNPRVVLYRRRPHDARTKRDDGKDVNGQFQLTICPE